MYIKNIMPLLAFLGASSKAMAFVCSTNNGPFVTQGSADITVAMTPQIQQNYNLIVDLSEKIVCYNEDAGGSNYDWVVFTIGSVVYSLPSARKYIFLNGDRYDSPLRVNTTPFGFPPGRGRIRLPLSFVISPIQTAGQGVIRNGEQVATLNMYKTYPNANGSPQLRFTWNVYSAADVSIPIGGCDVSARNVSVTLPAYDATSNQTVPVPLTVNCPSGNKLLSYTLDGTTVGASRQIFRNSAASSPAYGIGINMLDKNNNVITANNPVSLGTVGASPVDLQLKARYAQTGAQVTAGTVQSIIGVTFTYP
ncbi:hypothetical protein L581_3692 [Serratia fonticola AU-AP2C]|nr:hypothetical protein L581_3692 [Serratia fonticola AU-AP2C]